MKNLIRGILIFLLLIGISLNDVDAIEGKWVKDSLRRSVQIPQEVRRIIAIGPGALRLLIFLEGFEKVVGVEQAERDWSPIGRPYRMAYPGLSELPIIGLGGPDSNPNPEAILKVNPDLIIATYMSGEQADKLQYRTGKPVVILSYGSLGNFHSEELFQSLLIGGEVLNRKRRAEAIVTYIKMNLETLQKRTRDFPEERKPNVYVGALGLKGGHGIESTECEFPPFLAVNARNVMKNCKGHRFVDREFLLRVDPDALFLDLGNLHLVKQDYKKQGIFYKSLKAFRTKEVYGIFPFNYYATNVETALVDSYLIGQILYPERFSDISFEEKAREIFRFFVGQDVYDRLKEKYGKAGRIDTSQW
ncbi:MAG: iron ABC transporter substrate-binding protein [Thermodesulfobacteriota bacterium]